MFITLGARMFLFVGNGIQQRGNSALRSLCLSPQASEKTSGIHGTCAFTVTGIFTLMLSLTFLLENACETFCETSPAAKSEEQNRCYRRLQAAVIPVNR